MLTIIQSPSPVLTAKAKKVEKIDKYIQTLITDMITALEAAKDPEGVGLAAPQIGKSLQIFIVKKNPTAKISTFINPELTILDTPDEKLETKHKEKKKRVKLEGCLSLQDIWGVVHRHPSVLLGFLDEKGRRREKKFTGYLATIVQHEYDHLQGTLFPTRVLSQKEKLYKSSKDEKGEMVFEEIKI